MPWFDPLPNSYSKSNQIFEMQADKDTLQEEVVFNQTSNFQGVNWLRKMTIFSTKFPFWIAFFDSSSHLLQLVIMDHYQIWFGHILHMRGCNWYAHFLIWQESLRKTVVFLTCS